MLYETSISNEPKQVEFSSNLAMFVKGINDYIVFKDNNLNLLLLGFSGGDSIKISRK